MESKPLRNGLKELNILKTPRMNSSDEGKRLAVLEKELKDIIDFFEHNK